MGDFINFMKFDMFYFCFKGFYLVSMKSRFFANISHEFRTPLTLILRQVESVLPQLRSESVKSKLRMAARNAKQLLRLIKQLLDLSKIDAGIMSLRATSDNIVPLLKKLTGFFESLANQKNITLQFETEFDTLQIYYEQEKIECIMYNLLSNALKFTQEGGLVRLYLSASSTQKSLTRLDQQPAPGSQHPAARKLFSSLKTMPMCVRILLSICRIATPCCRQPTAKMDLPKRRRRFPT
ncbi:MAG: sensor histidine kinase [Calditrichaeota bacterium]|nr:MAG: sensor histidine kinase [Calditrichota bacterium]